MARVQTGKKKKKKGGELYQGADTGIRARKRQSIIPSSYSPSLRARPLSWPPLLTPWLLRCINNATPRDPRLCVSASPASPRAPLLFTHPVIHAAASNQSYPVPPVAPRRRVALNLPEVGDGLRDGVWKAVLVPNAANNHGIHFFFGEVAEVVC